MLHYRLRADEQELTISACRTDDVMTVYSSDRREMRKLDRLCAQYPEVYRNTWVDGQIMGDGLPMGKQYAVPRRYVRFCKPASDARRAAGRAAMERINRTQGAND